MLKIITILLLVVASLSFVTLAEQPDGGHKDKVVVPSKDFLEKYVGKVRAEIILDEITGFLTYQLRCISDESVKIHMESLAEAEVEFRIEPDVDKEKVTVDWDDQVFSDAYTPVPYDQGKKVRRTGVDVTFQELVKERERERTQWIGLWNLKRMKRSQDRFTSTTRLGSTLL
ncbi:MAG: hypothetical protein V1899_03895 [Planctomycetota bacterium]